MEVQARTIAEPATQSDGVQRADRTTRNVSLASAGAILVALKAISCPLTLILLSFGVGTAWLGDLSGLAPYQPLFFALAAAQLGLGYYLVYWKPRKAHAKVGAGAQLSPNRLVKFSLWSATTLVAAAVAFNYLGPALVGIH
ncbi:MAG: mercury transporter MerT [Rhodospirillales bacterium]|nr:mercury transporter MerT [Rhodospirillales bacterium]